MNENDSKQVDGNTKHVCVDKRADILQATFEHYYGMAMDHHTKAATTSNILLGIVGAILVLVGLDKGTCRSVLDVGSAIAVMLIGLFGAVWAWKQHERYHYWQFIADEYQKELKKIMPELETRHAYENGAEAHAKDQFGHFFAKTLKDRYLWVILNLIIIVIGIGLLILSLLKTCRL
jgi:ABC-type nickel/cobalt efflux system permease component RcnA